MDSHVPEALTSAKFSTRLNTARAEEGLINPKRTLFRCQSVAIAFPNPYTIALRSFDHPILIFAMNEGAPLPTFEATVTSWFSEISLSEKSSREFLKIIPDLAEKVFPAIATRKELFSFRVSPPFIDPTKFSLPIGGQPLVFGSYAITPRFPQGGRLHVAFCKPLEVVFKRLMQLSFELVSTYSRLLKASSDIASGKHFGAFSTAAPSKLGIKGASVDELQNASTKLESCTKAYHTAVGQIVLETYQAVIDRLQVQIVETARQHMDEFRDELGFYVSNTPKDLLNTSNWESRLFSTYIVFGLVPEMLIHCQKFISDLHFAKVTKQYAQSRLVELVQDDLMDLETSKTTVEQLVRTTVRDELNKLKPTPPSKPAQGKAKSGSTPKDKSQPKEDGDPPAGRNTNASNRRQSGQASRGRSRSKKPKPPSPPSQRARSKTPSADRAPQKSNLKASSKTRPGINKARFARANMPQPSSPRSHSRKKAKVSTTPSSNQ